MAEYDEVRIGKVVKVRGVIGPAMSVEAVDESTDLVECIWFDKDSNVVSYSFRIEALEVVR